MFILTQGPLVQNYSTTSEAPADAFVYSCHRPLKVRTDGVHARVVWKINMVATGHGAVAKMNPSYVPGGANVHSFHHLSEQISLPHYTVPQVSVFYIARNIDEILTYNSVGLSLLILIFSYYFLRKKWENP